MKYPNVFDYNDYFEFLKDIYELNKKSSPVFSYQAFANRLGLSKSSIYDAINFRKKISIKNYSKIIKALNLSEVESEYFLYLFLESISSGETTQYFKDVRNNQYNSCYHVNNESQVAIEDPQFFLVLSSLRTIKEFNGREDLINILIPKTSLGEETIEAILNYLEAKELIKLSDDEVMITKDNNYSFGNSIKNFSQFSSHFDERSQQFIEFYKENVDEPQALESFKPFTIDHLYVALTKEEAKELDKKLLFLRNSLASNNERDPNETRVYQLDLRMFPASIEH